MIVTLEQIVDIRTGHTFRKPPEELPGSGIRMLQIKDLRNFDFVEADQLPEIAWDGSEVNVLQPGEVVIAARGLHNRAAFMPTVVTNPTEKVIPSNQLLTLRPKNEQVLPAYLSWVLNYATSQRQLDDMRVGSSIPSISKQRLLELRVPLPNLSRQQKIIKLYQLRLREKELELALENNRETMLLGMYEQLLKDDDK